MKTPDSEPVTLVDLCHITLRSSATIITIVEYGIVEPRGDSPENWRFNAAMIAEIHKALRLHDDLDIDWAGIALAIDLIDEVERLRESNRALQNCLQRFVESP